MKASDTPTLTQADMDAMRDRIDAHFAEKHPSAHVAVLANVERFGAVKGNLGRSLAHSYMASKLAEPPDAVFATPAFKVCRCDNGWFWQDDADTDRPASVAPCAKCLGRPAVEPEPYEPPPHEPEPERPRVVVRNGRRYDTVTGAELPDEPAPPQPSMDDEWDLSEPF